MLFQRIKRTDPEKIFVVVKNGYSTASLTNGQWVRWDHDSAVDGVTVTIGSADAGLSVAGCVSETIAYNDYGLVQVYGYHSAARVRTMTTTGHTYNEALLAIAKGSPLAFDITADVFCAEGINNATGNFNLAPCGFALAAQASFTTKAIAVFVKSL